MSASAIPKRYDKYIRVQDSIHRRLKSKAAMAGRTVQEVTEDILLAGLQRRSSSGPDADHDSGTKEGA